MNDQGLFSKASNIASNVWDNMPWYDKAALMTSPIPVVGDVVGLGADLTNLYKDPNWVDAGLTAAGLLPWVPPAAAKRTWEAVSQNMINDLPTFYKGGKVMEMGRTGAIGVKNALLQSLSPTGQALMRQEGISKTTRDVTKKKLKSIEQLETKRNVLEKAGADPETLREINAEISKETKRLQGQIGQNTLLGEQYKRPLKAAKIGEKGTYVDMTGFSKENLSKSFKGFNLDPIEQDRMFNAISQVQGLKEGDSLMAVKQAVSSPGAGNLSHSVRMGGSFPILEQMFSSRPVNEPFKSFKNFENALMEGLSKTNKTKVKDRELLPELKKAFRNNDVLKNAETAEEFSDELKRLGIKGVTPTMVKRAFSKLPRKPFKNNLELIENLESKGIRVYNKEKALQGDPVLIMNSHKSSSFELGGVNIVTTVRPDGTTTSLVNDVNDIGGFRVPGTSKRVELNTPKAEKMITVSTPVDIDLGNNKVRKNAVSRTQKLERQTNMSKGREEAAKAVETAYGVDPFNSPVKQLNPAQRAVASAVATVEPEVLMEDRLRVLRNAGILGGGGLFRGVKPIERNYEEEY